MVNLFSNTFEDPYFDYLISDLAQHFTGIVLMTERIEQVIRQVELLSRKIKKTTRSTSWDSTKISQRSKRTIRGYQDIHNKTRRPYHLFPCL
jgi:hypothetical protein